MKFLSLAASLQDRQNVKYSETILEKNQILTTTVTLTLKKSFENQRDIYSEVALRTISKTYLHPSNLTTTIGAYRAFISQNTTFFVYRAFI